ncbi:MAG: hypothetical protein GY756_02405 [bacterium]|nr:hypothetical protein [bacterium]
MSLLFRGATDFYNYQTSLLTLSDIFLCFPGGLFLYVDSSIIILHSSESTLPPVLAFKHLSNRSAESGRCGFRIPFFL